MNIFTTLYSMLLHFSECEIDTNLLGAICMCNYKPDIYKKYFFFDMKEYFENFIKPYDF